MNAASAKGKSAPSAKKGLRGSALLLVSKIWFIIASWGIVAGLSRFLGVEGFGRYGLITAAATVINMCFIRGMVQAVAKFVSEDLSQTEAVKSQALKVQLWMGGGGFLLFFGFSGLIASFLNAPELAPYLRLSAFIILFYAFYAVFIGVLNGRKEFGAQALFDISFSTLKILLTLLLAYFLHLLGAILGFVLASGIVLVWSAIVVGWRRSQIHFPAKKIIRFCVPVMLMTLVLHLIMYLDLFLLKALSPPELSAVLAGWYTADLTFARLPYMIVVSALSLVLFPFVSQSTYQEDKEKTVRYIHHGMRLTYLVILWATVLIASSPQATLRFIYPQAYSESAPAMAWISGGYLLFSLFVTALTVISGSGRPQHALTLAVITLALQLLALMCLVPKFNILGAAWGSSSAFLLGAVLSGVYLVRRLGAFLPLAVFLKITLAGSLVFAISGLLPAGGLGLLMKDAFLTLIFISALVLFKEVGRKDWEMLLSTLPFKK